MLRLNRLINVRKSMSIDANIQFLPSAARCVRLYWTSNDYEQNINKKILLSLNEIKYKLDTIILSNKPIYYNIFETEIKKINTDIKNIMILLDKK